ncbi:hypothetical protein JHK87_056038 [Glycine soja]|nr:hypothetical protein JHK87_056038 [Glycine soja]
MAVKKCYCEKQFQDTAADRKRHVQGIQQQQAKARWYDSFKQQQIPPVPNRSLCFHFVNTGFCRYGDSCKYLHPIPNNNLQQPPVLTTPSPSPPPGNVVGVSLDNLPPLLQPPPEGVYPHLPFSTGDKFVILRTSHYCISVSVFNHFISLLFLPMFLPVFP